MTESGCNVAEATSHASSTDVPSKPESAPAKPETTIAKEETAAKPETSTSKSNTPVKSKPVRVCIGFMILILQLTKL